MVAGEQAGSTIICFRCNEEVQAKATDANEESAPIVEVEKVNWYLQTPYPEKDLFAVLGVDMHAGIIEIKKACRSIQKTVSREGCEFQQAQIAKDILVKSESRLWYETLCENLADLWQGMAKKKLLHLHDRAVVLHRRAIETEMEKMYVKANSLWQKALASWLEILQAPWFQETIEQRGAHLFDKKFKPGLGDKLCIRILDEVLINTGCQFRERYLGEEYATRAKDHLKFLAPILQYRYNIGSNLGSKHLLIAYLTEEIEALIGRGKWKKILPLLVRLQALSAEDKGATAFVLETFTMIAPFIGQGKRSEMAKLLGAKQ